MSPQERYVLERRLAIGGMAEIFLARVAGLEGFEKKVVLKRMLPHFVDKPEYVDMFLDEARLAGRFHHPNLIAVHELTRIDGLYCLAMEYIEGKDLDNVLDACHQRNRRLEVETAAYIIAEVADALHYAHELTTEDGKPLNVVHRDISPANIIVTDHGGVKLVDFGIAKSEVVSRKTDSGVVKGKFAYMSPEQIAGKNLDRRSDIFSLGVVLYEMLTLEGCFHGDTPWTTIQAITNAEIVPLQELRPDLPAEIIEITNRMLAPERNNRVPTAEVASRELRGFLANRHSPNPAEIRSLMRELFETSKTTSVRGYSGVGGRDTVQISGELSGPEVGVSEAVYREMIDEQAARNTITISRGKLDRDRREDTNRATPAASDAKPPDLITGSTTDMREVEAEPVVSAADLVISLFKHSWQTLLGAAVLIVAGLTLVAVMFPERKPPVATPPLPEKKRPVVHRGITLSSSDLEPEEPSDTGAIVVATEPSSAQVTVDGVNHGWSPVRVSGLSPGPHELVVQDDKVTKKLTVTVERGGDHYVTVKVRELAQKPTPTDASAQKLYDQGYRKLKARKNARAQELFLRCIQADATFAPCYRGLALLAARRGDEEKALYWSKKYADLTRKVLGNPK